MPSPKRTTAADGPCPPRAPDQAVILVNLPDFTPSIKRTRPKTGEPSPVSGRDRPEQPGAQNAGHRRFDLRHPCSGGPRVRILLPPAVSQQRTELGEFSPREGGFPMVSSRSFGNDHLIDRLAAGIAGAAGRISTDPLRSRSALFIPVSERGLLLRAG
jgi:hypothetical protein